MMDENKHSYAGDSMRRVEDEEMITGPDVTPMTSSFLK